MFTTVDDVKKYTGYEVTLETVTMAQAIIESYIGKVEESIDNVNDLAVLSKATAYQAAYMHNNYDKVFEQAAVATVAQTDGGIRLMRDMDAPFIAPLAVLTIRALSWKSSRSVYTGRFNPFTRKNWSWEKE